MHKEQLSTVTVAHSPSDFVITTSIDGVVKFWKKAATGIEFAKEYRAHNGRILSNTISADNGTFATLGDAEDKTIKIFDVVTFDLLSVIELSGPAQCICYVHPKGRPPVLAAAMDRHVQIYEGRGEFSKPLHTLQALHRHRVCAMVYNLAFDCVVSADESGMVEYWRPSDTFEKPNNVWQLKSSTNLFDFKKSKSTPCCINISPSGHQFATFSFPDRRVRIFDFVSGKLHRSYDESLATITDMQQAGTALHRLDDVEFGRRIAVEKELDNAFTKSCINIAFDESGHFVFLWFASRHQGHQYLY